MMIGGENRGRRTSRSDFRNAGAWRGRHSAHARTRKHRRHCRTGLPALRSKRRRPLCQDGPQRNRIWPDGRVCGRVGHSALRNVGKQRTCRRRDDAASRSEHYQYDLNLRDIAEVWRRGSVIASWLLDLTAAALCRIPNLPKFAGRVSDSGEGRWTIKAAIDEAVPAPVLDRGTLRAFQLARRGRLRRTSCFPPCDSNSADIWKSRPERSEAH